MRFEDLKIGDVFISVHPGEISFCAFEKKSLSSACDLIASANYNLVRDGNVTKFSKACAVYKLIA